MNDQAVDNDRDLSSNCIGTHLGCGLCILTIGLHIPFKGLSYDAEQSQMPRFCSGYYVCSVAPRLRIAFTYDQLTKKLSLPPGDLRARDGGFGQSEAGTDE